MSIREETFSLDFSKHLINITNTTTQTAWRKIKAKTTFTFLLLIVSSNYKCSQITSATGHNKATYLLTYLLNYLLHGAEGRRVQIFENNFNKSKFYSGKNYEQIEVRECLLSFGAESFVFHFANKSIKMKVYRTIILPVVLYGCVTWSLIEEVT